MVAPQVWEVECKSRCYDGEYESGSVYKSVDINLYVIAGSKEEALKRIEPKLVEEINTRYGKYADEVRADAKITASVVSLENLVAAREIPESESWKCFGYNLRHVDFSVEEDAQRYKLGVCLFNSS